MVLPTQMSSGTPLRNHSGTSAFHAYKPPDKASVSGADQQRTTEVARSRLMPLITRSALRSSTERPYFVILRERGDKIHCWVYHKGSLMRGDVTYLSEQPAIGDQGILMTKDQFDAFVQRGGYVAPAGLRCEIVSG